MNFFKIAISLTLFAISANGSKVTWGEDGKPIIEASSSSIEGCIQGGINNLGRSESNTSTSKMSCSH